MSHKKKITCSLATMKEREESLKDTVKSLLPQVDKLNVYLHGYTTMPQFLKNDKIEVAFDLEHGDHGDIDKLAWIDEVKGYHIICDDDLIYPPDYIREMVKAIDKYGKKAIVSFHGSVIYKLPIAQYYQDRGVYPCLGEVREDASVDLPGTGVMGYHSGIGLDKADFREKIPNMLDIHLGIWAKENSIPVVVIAHKEGWIKHSEKVSMEKTIFAKSVNNDFLQTSTINAVPHLFNKKKPYVEGLPVVSIVVINARGKSNPEYLKMCFDSIRNQSYPNIEPVVIENFDKLATIGKCFNVATQKAKGDWVYYLGDDDMLSPDFIQSLMTYLQEPGNESLVSVTTYLTMFRFNELKANQEPRQLTPTGLWKRSHVLEYPFPEYLTRYVDTAYIEENKAKGFHQALVGWHYGYFYRSHTGQVSGHKALINSDDNASWRTDDIKKRLKEI